MEGKAKPKSSLSALDLAALIHELRAFLPARVNAVNALHSKGVSLELYSPSAGTAALVLDAGGFAFLTEASTKRVAQSSFASACSRLKGLWLREALQVDFDRVVILSFSDDYSLVYELLGKGNLLLLKGGRVLSATTYLKVKDRSIEPGSEYRAPPTRGADLSVDVELRGETILRALVHSYNVPAEVVAEALFRVGLNPETEPSKVDGETVRKVREVCLEIVEGVRAGRLEPNIAYSDGEMVDVHPVVFKHQPYRVEPKKSFSSAVSEYYEPALKRILSEQAVKELSGKAERLLASASKNRQVAQEWLARAESLKKMADILSQNTHVFEHTLKAARRNSAAEARAPLESLGLDVGQVDGVTLTLTFDGASFTFDPRRSVYDNLGLVYGEVKSLRKKYEEALKAAEALQKQAETIGQEAELEKARVVRVSVAHKKWFEKYRWFITSTGKLVVAGKDAEQNQSIARRYARQGYVALHADIQGAPFTLLFGEADEKSLQEAAQFAASYSRAWSLGLQSVDVFYADASKVSLQPPPGEYLPKGGVMFHEKHYLKGVTLGVCVGFVKLDDGELRVASWPMAANSELPCVCLSPGDEDRNTVAKKVLKILCLQSGEYGEFAKTVRVDELLPLIPGSSRLTGHNRPT